MGKKPTGQRGNGTTKPCTRGSKQVLACKVVLSKQNTPCKSRIGTMRQEKTQEKQTAMPSTTLVPLVPLKIVKGTDSDDDEVDDWLLSQSLFGELVLPPGWILHPDFDRYNSGRK